jgi:hypothetical protein
MYMPLAAANKTPLVKTVNGKMNCEIGEDAVFKMGVIRIVGAKGMAMARHMRAFESAPPNPPE